MPRKKNISDSDIIQLYLDGAPSIALSEYSGLTMRAVRNILHKHNVPIRKIGQPRKHQVNESFFKEWSNEEFGGTTIYIQADISKVEDVKKYIKATVDTFGRIDCLVNNAGIIGNREAIINYDEDTFSNVLDTNVKGTFYGLKYSIQEMMKTGGGSIVNVASVLGTSGCPSMSAYSASKHAIIGLTKSAVSEFGGMNIRVNALCPGFIGTELGQDSMPEQMKAYLLNRVPMKRLGFVEEVTNNALFLLSDEAKYINGTIHVIDGGLSSSYL